MKAWKNLKNYQLQEDALDKLFFELLPIFFSVYPVAEHTLSLKIDERLRQDDVTLVNEIQNVTINGVTRKFYSFSTKYCSHHNPKE